MIKLNKLFFIKGYFFLFGKWIFFWLKYSWELVSILELFVNFFCSVGLCFLKTIFVLVREKLVLSGKEYMFLLGWYINYFSNIVGKYLKGILVFLKVSFY